MNQFKALPEIPTQSSNLCNKIAWSTVSKAALRSSRTKTETLSASVLSFVTLIRTVSVLWWGLKPNWKVSKALLDRRNSVSCLGCVEGMVDYSSLPGNWVGRCAHVMLVYDVHIETDPFTTTSHSRFKRCLKPPFGSFDSAV